MFTRSRGTFSGRSSINFFRQPPAGTGWDSSHRVVAIRSDQQWQGMTCWLGWRSRPSRSPLPASPPADCRSVCLSSLGWHCPMRRSQARLRRLQVKRPGQEYRMSFSSHEPLCVSYRQRGGACRDADITQTRWLGTPCCSRLADVSVPARSHMRADAPEGANRYATSPHFKARQASTSAGSSIDPGEACRSPTGSRKRGLFQNKNYACPRD
jgi:hypothetical protein